MCLGFQDVINSTGNSTLTINYSFEIYYTSPNGISCYYHLDIAFVPALWVDFRFHQPKKKEKRMVHAFYLALHKSSHKMICIVQRTLLSLLPILHVMDIFKVQSF